MVTNDRLRAAAPALLLASFAVAAFVSAEEQVRTNIHCWKPGFCPLGEKVAISSNPFTCTSDCDCPGPELCCSFVPLTDKICVSPVGHCFCPDYYAPVCGNDGKTYSNQCWASCARVGFECLHECPCSVCPCVEIYLPICGEDDITYSNSCFAACAGTTQACEGECPCEQGHCICPAEFEPVCGDNGKTYDSSCKAFCSGATIACNDACPCGAPAPAFEGDLEGDLEDNIPLNGFLRLDNTVLQE